MTEMLLNLLLILINTDVIFMSTGAIAELILTISPDCPQFARERMISGPNQVTDDQLSASSFLGPNPNGKTFFANDSRYADSSTGWARRDRDQSGEWLAVDFYSPQSVIAVTTRGRTDGNNAQYVTKYVLEYNLEGSWIPILEGGSAKEFSGNNAGSVINWLDPIVTSSLRLTPVMHHDWPVVQWEVYVCKIVSSILVGNKYSAKGFLPSSFQGEGAKMSRDLVIDGSDETCIKFPRRHLAMKFDFVPLGNEKLSLQGNGIDCSNTKVYYHGQIAIHQCQQYSRECYVSEQCVVDCHNADSTAPQTIMMNIVANKDNATLCEIDFVDL